MTIYLNPEVKSGLGEDTFWTWAAREFPKAVFVDDAASVLSGHPTLSTDRLLQYSTMGPPPVPHHPGTIALLFELHPEMRLQLASSEWDDVIARTERCAATCSRRVVSTEFARPFYERFGKVDVLPIGVDCELFRPVSPEAKQRLREDYSIPPDRRVGFWMGTHHRMKGFDRLQQYAAEHPDIHWILAWKTRGERVKGHWVRSTEFTHVPQAQLAELMNCADFFLSCGRLRPFFMVEWEAMACDLPCVNISGLPKDFEPGPRPREQVFARGWDRVTAKKTWLEYLGNN